MKRLLFFCLLLAAIDTLMPALVSQKLLVGVFAGKYTTQSESSAFSQAVSVRVIEHSYSLVKVHEGRDLLSSFIDNEGKTVLLSGQIKPLALAADDFNEDGSTDLICAYGSGTGGLLTMNPGNPKAIPGKGGETKHLKAGGNGLVAPFLLPAFVFEVEESPDFICVGDFDADTHRDIVTAARGGNRLHFLRGDGKGRFLLAKNIDLTAPITAMFSGDINRADGLADLIVGTQSMEGALALIFESPNGAMNATAEELALPAPPVSFAVGELDGDYSIDLALACGNQLVVVQGRDRKLSLDPAQQAQVKASKIGYRKFPVSLKSVVIGDFTGNRGNNLAVLGEDGKLRVLSAKARPKQKSFTTIASWKIQVLAKAPVPQATAMYCAPMSSQAGDSLIVADGLNHRLHIMATTKPLSGGLITPSMEDLQATELQMDSEPVALLPLRLNEDGLSDLVILRQGEIAPAIVVTAAAMTFTVSNTNDSGSGSLNQAILNANANPGADIINFDIGAGGPQTISLTTPLPVITETVTINATSQPGFTGAPIIELNGTAMVNTCLAINASNCAVRGLVVNRFLGDGVSIANANGAIIENNFIGTNLAGTAALVNNGVGVRITNSSNNRIGGTTTASGNLISGNISGGIDIGGVGSTGNLIQGNFIGTNRSGDMAIGNGNSSGILIETTALNSNNTIGGTAVAARNIISGNIGTGLTINDTASGNLIQNNFFGLSVSGLSTLSNGDSNIVLMSANNTVGGTASGARNLISGSGQSGVLVSGPTSSGNQVQGNFIGTDINGLASQPNLSDGVKVDGGGNNFIGGASSAARNLISGNAGNGIILANTASNQILSNFIGTDVTGTSPLPNGQNGVTIFQSSSNNFIGSAASPNSGNVIAFNGGSGVGVITGTGNRIQMNSILSNNLLGINLSDDGVTPNDPGDSDSGPNELQNFPVITSAIGSGSATLIQGTLNSIPNATYRLEFFAGPSCDASGNGEGQTFIGSTSAATDSTGNSTFNVSFMVTVPAGQSITATATDGAGNTSEFSACATLTIPPCAVICPQNQVVVASNTQCGAVVNFPDPMVVGSCGQVTCTPPSGSFFGIGTTPVNCTNGVGVGCTFTVTVIDRTAPVITCPAPIIINPPAGQRTAVVNYPQPVANDNCTVASVICRPPSGAVFPIGATNVQCVAIDEAGNEGACQFAITVRDQEAPGIVCPANLVVDVPIGQMTATVNYPAPTVTDNLPGASAVCAPPSGSVFSLGVTTIVCTASDLAGNQSSCRFTINLRGGSPVARVEIPGGRDNVPFGLNAPLNPVRKIPKKKGECGFFKIRNEGFTPLILTLDSIMRTGSVVTSGKINDPNDSGFYELSLINADQSETVLAPGDSVQIGTGSERNFCLRFTPFIPSVVTNSSALAAKDVLSNQLTSRVTFRLAGGNPVIVNVAANLSTTLLLINATNPRKQAVVTFERRGNEFIFLYSVFDTNLDVRKTTYEFFDASGNLFGQPIDVDLTQALAQANLIKGQSFTVEQRFTGAATNPEVSGGRITVFDGEGSVSRVAENVSTSGLTTSAVSPSQRSVITPTGTRVKRLMP